MHKNVMSRRMKEKGLGQALKNKLEKKKVIYTTDHAPIFYQQTQQNDADIKKMKMKSIIDQNSLSEFLQVAEMSQQNFQANRDLKFRDVREEVQNKKIIAVNPKNPKAVQFTDQKVLSKLQIPRRPDWKTIKGKQELEQAQNQAYLGWRRKLAEIEETQSHLVITPYQKNLQVWRQLWRVIERADLLIQIVDGRDPMFFRCEDLHSYAQEISPLKQSLVLVNKSDLVSEEARIEWNKYFLEHGIDHFFFSAVKAQEEIRNQEKVKYKEENTQKVEETIQKISEESENQTYSQLINSTKILSIKQMASLLNICPKKYNKNHIEVGLVGYPNVGKSSVINSLLGKKKVGVANMPGKTKHFQTLALSETVTLCDCPGLVFPRASSTESQMVLNGLYPIDSIKKHEEPLEIISLRIKREYIEKLYSLHWKEDEMYDGNTITGKYSQLKGFYTGSGLPNHSMAAKQILKDYVSGTLVFVHHPNQGIAGGLQEVKVKEIQLKREVEKAWKKEKEVENELDNQFFQEKAMTAKSVWQVIEQLTEEDMLDIIDGRRISQNLKVTKQMRKSIKFALKRGETIQAIRKLLVAEIQHEHKVLIKV